MRLQVARQVRAKSCCLWHYWFNFPKLSPKGSTSNVRSHPPPLVPSSLSSTLEWQRSVKDVSARALTDLKRFWRAPQGQRAQSHYLEVGAGPATKKNFSRENSESSTAMWPLGKSECWRWARAWNTLCLIKVQSWHPPEDGVGCWSFPRKQGLGGGRWMRRGGKSSASGI